MKTRITSETTVRFVQEELVAFVAKHLKLVALKSQISLASSKFL